MKIINVEDGKEVIYVQNNDMAYIMHSCDVFPPALMEEFFSNIALMNGENGYGFVRYTDPSIIEFIKNLDWIIDYREYRDLSLEEIIELENNVMEEMNEISHVTADSNEEKANLYGRYCELKYKLECIRKFLLYKKGNIEYEIPVVPDSQGFNFDGDPNYKISSSLEPNKVLLYRLDGKELTEDEPIPVGFYQMGMSIGIMENSKKLQIADCTTTNRLSEDKKYLITEIIIEDKEKNKEEETEEQKKDKGIRRLTKRLINN